MLYFDESGYTGPDLVNSKQPYFSLASIRITDEEIAQIKKDIGYCEWGKELHFKSMYKSYQGQKMLDKIFNHPLMDNYHVLLSFAYKRYCIYANIVNILSRLISHFASACDILRSMVEISISRKALAKTFLMKVAV